MQSDWINSAYLDLLDLADTELESGYYQNGMEVYDQEEPDFKPRPPSSASTAFCLSPEAVQVKEEDFLTDPGYIIPSVSRSETRPPSTSPYPQTRSCVSVSPAPQFLKSEDLQLDSLDLQCFGAQLYNLHDSARLQETPRPQETFSYAEGACEGAKFSYLPPPPPYDVRGTFHPSPSCSTFSTYSYVGDQEYGSCGYQSDRPDSFPNTPSSFPLTDQGVFQSTSVSVVPSTVPFLSSSLTPTIFSTATTTDLPQMKQDVPYEQEVYSTGGSMCEGVKEHAPPQLPLTLPVLQNLPDQSDNRPVPAPSTSRDTPLPQLTPPAPTASPVTQPAPQLHQLLEPFVQDGPSMTTADSDMMGSLDLGNLHPRLAKAAQECVATGTVTPIIKEELRLSILSRRHSRGQDEPQVTFTPPKKYELTPEEQNRKVKRKEMNRMAAKRHRMKKKNQTNTLLEEYQELEKKNAELTAQINLLEAEKKTFLFILSPAPP